jgi:hypothetical protein
MLVPMRVFAFLVGTLVAAAPAAAINPLDLMGKRPKPFVEPEGYYRVIIPSGFDCKKSKNIAKREIKCDGTRGPQAVLYLQVLDVPPSANADLVALNEMDRLKKKQHFKHLDSARQVIDGISARMEKFTYDYMGNVEYPVGVQALYLVKKNKLFVLHFEARLDQFKAYEQDLTQLYGSFRPAPLDEGGNPILEDVTTQKVKKRVRTDEDLIQKHLDRSRKRDKKLTGGK